MFSRSRFLTIFLSLSAFLHVFSVVAFYYPRAATRFALNLNHANIARVNLAGANLRWVNLTGAVLEGTDLRGADLRDAIGLTREQLALALVDDQTILPVYLRPASIDHYNPTPPENKGLVPPDPSWHQRMTKKEIIIDLSADILFDFDKSTIRPDAVPSLQKLADLIEQSGDGTVQLNGHTDSIASEGYNLDLSRQRAESVKQWLSEKAGIDPGRFQTKGYGKSRPVAPNTNASGRQKNRRVEVIIPRKTN